MRQDDGKQRGRTEAWPLVAVLVVAFGGWLAVALQGLVYPYTTSYVEGFLLEQAVRLAEGGSLYRPLGEPAWIVDNFPPVYPVLLAAGVKAFGATFAFGRMLTLGTVAGLALVAWLAHRRTGCSKLTAAAVVALWLLSPYVLRRAMLVRMDFAALLLVTLGILAYLHLSSRRPVWAAPVAALFFAGALGVRQTFLAAPAALFVLLLAHRRWRDAGVLAGFLVGLGLVAVAVLQHLSDGGFLRHVVAYNTGRYLLDHLLVRLFRLLTNQPLLLPLASIGGFVAWRVRGFAERLVVVWGVFAFLVSSTAGKPGSTYNHFLETLYVAGLLAGAGAYAVHRWIEEPRRRPIDVRHVLAVLIVLQLAVVAFATPTWTAVQAVTHEDDDARLVALLRDTPGPVLSENAGALVQSGHDVLLEPRTLKELHLAGTWDEGPLVRMVQERAFSVIILEEFAPENLCRLGCRFTETTWTAIQGNYAMVEDLGRWQVWRPSA